MLRGTFWRFTVRLVAVTTISSRERLPLACWALLCGVAHNAAEIATASIEPPQRGLGTVVIRVITLEFLCPGSRINAMPSP